MGWTFLGSKKNRPAFGRPAIHCYKVAAGPNNVGTQIQVILFIGSDFGFNQHRFCLASASAGHGQPKINWPPFGRPRLTAGRPSAMGVPEIEKMLQASKPPEESPTLKLEFQKGDHVKIKEGPFENMEGTVDELLPELGKVSVIVTFFGRATPSELEYWQIEKSED